ncbi:amidohydrolase family protein, partial [Thermodesulfobacteriota bacterium]
MRLAKGGQVFLESFVYNHRDEKGNMIDERVDFDQALRGHTIDAAYCGHEEGELGSLEPGKLADLVVWNRDIREVGERGPLGRVKDVKPVMTVIDGEVAFHDETAGIVIDKA